MRLRGNEMICHRGETFTMDRTVVNRDGSPFIVSSEYENPYVLITVASTRYDSKDRYRVNWWLDLADLPRFLYTVPKRITSFDVTKVVGEEPGEYLYYVDEDGKRTYKYFDKHNVWHDYEFRIAHHFMNSITRDWIEQSYVYSIQLVSGESVKDYLKDSYKGAFGEYPSNSLTEEKIYCELKEHDPSLVDGVDFTKPIANFAVVQVLLEPTKLTVMSDLNGGF